MPTATAEPLPAPTAEQAQQFKDFLKQLIVISRDGEWTQPDQRLRDLVDEVKHAFAKAAAAKK